MAISVFLISDFCLLRKSIETLLGGESERFALAGVATSCDGAADAVLQVAPDVVLLDLDELADAALALITALHTRSTTKILLLSRLGDSALQDKAILLGARGVVDRHTGPEMLLTAIAKVMEGQLWLDREATGRIFVQLSSASFRKDSDAVSVRLAQLTEREKAIVAFIAGNSDDPGKKVASKLNISESTLRNHLTSIYVKLGVANRNGLLTYAFRNGLAERLGC